METRLELWKQRLKNVFAEEHPAETMYIGDHWSTARDIPSESAAYGWNIRLWICSAGYGLIQPSTVIKSYQATFASGSPDSVQTQDSVRASTQRWWDGVCGYAFSNSESSPRSLRQLAQACPRTPMVVALSADYLSAIGPELRSVLSDHQFFRSNLSIISCGTRDSQGSWGDNLLPCDSRVSTALGGTLTSLNARVARYLFQNGAETDPSVEALTKTVRTIVIEARSKGNGVPQSDLEVEQFIRRELQKTPQTSKSRLLELFRGSGKACEQKRFGALYVRLREEVEAEICS